MITRVRELIATRINNAEEKRRLNGITFIVNRKMCVSVGKERIMIRISQEVFEEALITEG